MNKSSSFFSDAWKSMSLKAVGVFVQFSVFFLIVNGLEKDDFAIYSAISAISLVFIHFLAPGFSNLIVKFGSRNYLDKVDEAFSISTLLVVFAGFLGSLFVCWWINEIAAGVSYEVAFYVVSEIIFMRMFEICNSFFHFRNPSYLYLSQLLFLMIRLCCVLVWFFLYNSEGQKLFVLLGMGNLIAMIGAWYFSHAKINLSLCGFRKGKYYIKEGFPFAVNISAKNMVYNIDKNVLARVGDSNLLADYSVAYRVAYIVFIPFHTLVTILLPRMFRLGVENPLDMFFKYLWVFLFGFLASFISGFIIYFGGSFLLLLAGEKYTSANVYLEWMMFYPSFMFVAMFMSEILTCSGWNWVRVKFQIVVAVLSVFGAFFWIDNFGALGGILNYYISEAMLLVFFVSFIFFKKSKGMS